MADDIYIKLVRNEKKDAEGQPDWVGPPNEESPPDKDWRIGVKIGDTWHNQAGWDGGSPCCWKLEWHSSKCNPVPLS